MIVLLDVDGTLVDYTATLPDSAAAAVRAAVAAGHRVYLCTGRSRAEIPPELWGLGVSGLIGGNGAYVESEGAVVHHQVMARSDVEDAVTWLRTRDVPFYLECNSGLFASPRLVESAAALLQGGATPANQAVVRDALRPLPLDAPGAGWREDTNKISFVLRDDLDLTALAAEVGPAVSIDTWSLTGRGPEFGEFGQVGVHKGRAVELLADHLGVGRADLVGFGDACSDLELLRACGTGVAMGQAPDELKRIATLVTDPVDADGLQHAFTRLGLDREPTTGTPAAR